jgi:hypothetical protein
MNKKSTGSAEMPEQFESVLEDTLERGYRITARRRGRWTILEGQVDRQSIKTRLIGSVPEHDGACWVVDRLSVRDVTDAF